MGAFTPFGPLEPGLDGSPISARAEGISAGIVVTLRPLATKLQKYRRFEEDSAFASQGLLTKCAGSAEGNTAF
jgi:hypothetical protein